MSKKMRKNNKLKEKIPSQFNDWLSPDYNNNLKFINLSKIKSCGRAENRTRNCWVTTNCFTIKLLAHNINQARLNYLNFIKTQILQ